MRAFFRILAQGRWLQRPCLVVLLVCVLVLVHDLLASTPLMANRSAVGLYAVLGLWALVLWVLLRSAEQLGMEQQSESGWWRRIAGAVQRGVLYLLTVAALMLGLATLYISFRLFNVISL